MEDQDVEYDSVADFRVAVSDDVDSDFFVADDVMENVSARHDVSTGTSDLPSA